MRQALSRTHKCVVLDGASFPWSRPIPDILPFFGLIPFILKPFFNLIITSDNYVYCDMLYVQPHAGGHVRFPWLDTMTFRTLSAGTSFSLRLMAPLGRAMYRRAALLSNSQYTRDLLIRSIGRGSSVLYPPVPTQLYRTPQVQREDQIITLSSLNPRKNLLLIPSVATKLPGRRFGLIGYAVPEHLSLLTTLHRRFASEAPQASFRYYPSLADTDKATILQRTKVYFHPTVAEPFGIAVAEAMAAGCIPVVHDSGGVREFVPPDWRYSTPEEAATLIRKALEIWSPELAEQMREIAYQYREEVFVERFLGYVEYEISGAADADRP